MSLTTDLKDYALSIGFTKVGITTAEDFTDFEDELASRGSIYECYHDYFRPSSKPNEIYPSAKSIIVLAYDYAQYTFPEELTQKIARAYQSRSYLPLLESPAGKRIERFKDFLNQNRIPFSDDKNLLIMRRAAARAGVANFGRNNFSYVDGAGSFVILYGFLVDQELEPDEPTMECKCPPNCRKCMDACPTKAIYEPFKLNPAKCIAFNNFETLYDREPFSPIIPRDMRPKLGMHIHGCDVCQEVCPRNAKKLNKSLPQNDFLEMLNLKITLADVLKMPDGYYEEYLYPIVYNYIRDKAFLQRNAAVAIGNTKDEKYVKDLEAQLSHPKEAVRTHVAWALGNIGGNKAMEILEKHRKIEASEKVRSEIVIALDA